MEVNRAVPEAPVAECFSNIVENPQFITIFAIVCINLLLGLFVRKALVGVNHPFTKPAVDYVAFRGHGELRRKGQPVNGWV